MITYTDILVGEKTERYHYFGAALERARDLEQAKIPFKMTCIEETHRTVDIKVLCVSRLNIPKENHG
jgi:hypothetical protein